MSHFSRTTGKPGPLPRPFEDTVAHDAALTADMRSLENDAGVALQNVLCTARQLRIFVVRGGPRRQSSTLFVPPRVANLHKINGNRHVTMPSADSIVVPSIGSGLGLSLDVCVCCLVTIYKSARRNFVAFHSSGAFVFHGLSCWPAFVMVHYRRTRQSPRTSARTVEQLPVFSPHHPTTSPKTMEHLFYLGFDRTPKFEAETYQEQC